MKYFFIGIELTCGYTMARDCIKLITMGLTYILTLITG